MLKYKTVVVRFLITGHTRNRCDSAFGMVKQRLKSRDVNFPSGMMACMDDSSASAVIIGTSDVQWVEWKALLNVHFILPANSIF